jgi:predicted phage tail protein
VSTTYSPTASATTQAGADTTPPTTPGTLTVTPGALQMNLSWGPSTDNVGVTAYLIERCLTASCTFAQVGSVTTPIPPGTTYVDSGLTAFVSYSYRVRARDAANNLSGYTTTQSAVRQDCD